MEPPTAKAFLILVAYLAAAVNGALVVSTEKHDKEGKGTPTTSIPEIYQMRITSNIRNRFAHTTVTSRVRNSVDKPQEAVFSVVLPEAAYISGFVMEIDGKNYTAYVKEKEEAKRVYEQAVASGAGAAHVAVSARDSNRFVVSVNIEPESKAVFYLTYEQLLGRKDSRYEQIINIHPGQAVKDLSVEVVIAESRKITDLKAPPLRSGNEIGTDKPELDPRADIEIVNDTAAVVTFSPNVERQKELAHVFGTKEEEGLSGQFVVQYDVERDPSGGEVLIQDGYFVHFFAPKDLEPLPKHVVFVLDTSGSMWGQKIQQLIQAMHSIVDQLHETDLISLVEFSSNTKVWDLNNPEKSTWYPRSHRMYYDHDVNTLVTLDNATFPDAFPVNAEIISKAKLAVSSMNADGTTAMYGGLQVALRLVELERKRQDEANDVKRQPIIIFLTDGEPTDASPNDLTTKITEFNSEARRAPIFALSFGDGADREFLQKLSSRNSGFSKRIYEAGDASLQLEDFYRLVSSPLLSDVKFKYESTTATNVTKTVFPIYFGGSEIVVAGICTARFPMPTIEGLGIRGPITLKPIVTTTTTSYMERIWAYLSIRQLLEKKEATEGDENQLKMEALDLALKYNFVTPVSSLVVVKPNDTQAVDAEEAKRRPTFSGFGGTAHYGMQAGVPIGLPGLPGIAGPPGFGSHYGMSAGRPGPPGYRHDTLPLALPEPISIGPSPSLDPSEVLLSSLLQTFSWLANILQDGMVKTPIGSYKLGLNETIPYVACPKATNNQPGQCKLLHNCHQAVLPTVTDFYDHFCVLKNEFAGVCCPT
ncbi:inter-alpha-trypsin inhibitor heavy chain H4-like isoform X1 [Photinus pyralis]|uniref:inter-alpha-trypsin inhibitor heavy chain H4-like isoform X1 n=1 Tax=Photinus pyralis TaxID=7054 RepID=UPI001267746E|nr:inter-alpha-trypsin inhibitor heavy chain H4-like isoform X1 [Photinus pyralis]XP_031344972.1 inter-alpha-trypsin inhibitor heavy chain H4-like isoform X1 [Photinus pyralis]